MNIDRSVFEKIQETEKSDGVFISISYLKDDILYHYQYHKGFPKEDLLPSLQEIEKLVRKSMT